VAPSKREQESERTRAQLRRLRAKSLLILDRLGRWVTGQLARTLVIITVCLWLLILLLGVLTTRDEPQVPFLPLLPLYAFYPGKILSGQIGYNPQLLYAWGIGSAGVFLTLAIIAVWRRKTTAGTVLITLFFISTLIVYGRVVAELRHLHQ
jgi:hypothetical protein